MGGWHVHLHMKGWVEKAIFGWNRTLRKQLQISHMGLFRCIQQCSVVLVDFASVLTLCPWAEHGSCSAQGLLIFLPMQTWMEHGSCSALGLFFIYFVLLVLRPKLPLGQIVSRTLNPAACGVYLPKAVKTLMYWKFYEYAILYLLVQSTVLYVPFLCYWSAWFEASIEYTKSNCIIQIMCQRCNFLLGSVLNKIMLLFCQSFTHGKKQLNVIVTKTFLSIAILSNCLYCTCPYMSPLEISQWLQLMM